MSSGGVLSRFLGLAGPRGSLRERMVHGAVGTALVQAVGRLLALGLAIVLARGLGASNYGIYTYAFALLTLLMVVAELGVPTLIMREVAATEARQDWRYLRGVLVRGLQIVLMGSIAVALTGAAAVWWYSGGSWTLQSVTMAWMLALLPLAAVTKTMAAGLRGLGHVVKAQAMEMLIRPVFVLLGVGFLFFMIPELRLPQYAMAIQWMAAVIVLVVVAAMLHQYLPEPAHTTAARFRTRQWLVSAMPLTLIGGAGIINSQTDILMLGFFRTTDEVGIYRVAVQGAALVAFGLQAANAVIAPQFSRLYAQGDKARLQRLVTASARVILLAALPVALIFIIAGGAIAGWVFGPEFTASHLPLAILAAGQLVNAAMGSVGFLLNMTGHERDVARTLLITAGLNVLLNLFLIPPYGLAGAASATAVSLIIWNIVLCRIVKKRIWINSTAFSFNR